MMPTAEQIQVLKDILSWGKIKKYWGMMPCTLAAVHNDTLITQLLENETVERISVALTCGSEIKLLRLTEAGLDALVQADPSTQIPKDEYSPANIGECETTSDQELPDDIDLPNHGTASISRGQAVLLNDIFHYSNISSYGGMMPSDLLHQYPAKEATFLFNKGYIIRVKAEKGSGRKLKGITLSAKGLKFFNTLPAPIHSILG